jgi:aromatic ring-opening dioxygenase LigB subunit
MSNNLSTESLELVLLGVFFVPHGSIILDPTRNGIPPSARTIYKNMVEISQNIQQLKPDICLLVTPHGISLSHDYGLYFNLKAEGTAEWENDYKEFAVKIDLDQEETKKISQFLEKSSFPVSTITSYANSESIPLRWGEAVPLWFLKEINLKYIIMSIPTRRYDHTKAMIPELENLGGHLSTYLTTLEKRAIILISGDLAHAHSVGGPFGFSVKAEEFDLLIEKWVKTRKKRLLVKKAAEILDQALCCGFPGLIILQGILENTPLESNLLFRGNPTYYGMLLASFT